MDLHGIDRPQPDPLPHYPDSKLQYLKSWLFLDPQPYPVRTVSYCFGYTVEEVMDVLSAVVSA